jgi:hypothetical protein
MPGHPSCVAGHYVLGQTAYNATVIHDVFGPRDALNRSTAVRSIDPGVILWRE